MAASRDHEVIADVAPTVAVHVIILSAAHLGLALFVVGGVTARSCRMMDDGAGEVGNSSRATAISRAPAGAVTNGRLRRRSRLSNNTECASEQQGEDWSF